MFEDSENKSDALWSNKIKPWMKDFWPDHDKLNTPEAAKSLSFAMLHCGNKFPEAFELLQHKIKEVIKKNPSFHIGNYYSAHKKSISHIFDYPNEFLQLLNWNFPQDIAHDFNGKVKNLLQEIKNKCPESDQTENYRKLLDKLS